MLEVVKNEKFDFRLLIAKKGISQKEFARSIGISNSYLSQIINKKRNPSPWMAGKIARGLKVEVEDIFFIESGNKR